MSQVIDNSLVSMGTTNFGFSGASLDDLESSEYTIVTIAVDISSSVSGFRQQLEECLQTIVESCQRSPRSENLLFVWLSRGFWGRFVSAFYPSRGLQPFFPHCRPLCD